MHDLESCGSLLTSLAYATTDVASLVEWVENYRDATLIKYICQNTIAGALLILCQVPLVPSDMKPKISLLTLLFYSLLGASYLDVIYTLVIEAHSQTVNLLIQNVILKIIESCLTQMIVVDDMAI
jgi:hypothetical protein